MAEILVRDLMTEVVFSADPDDDVAKLCELMAEHHVRHVPVVDSHGKPVGMVSHRDLLSRQLIAPDKTAYAKDMGFAGLKAWHLMTTPVKTVEPETDIRIAAQIMYKHKIGCLPVVVDGRLTGILTEADFVRYLA